MGMDNLVAVQIPPKVLTELQTKVNDIVKTLTPFLISLTPEQRKTLPKMGDGTVPFVSKALGYAKSAPQFAPPYLSVPDLEIDVNAVNDLNSIFQPLSQLVTNLDDTIMLSGSEAYSAALTYYRSVQGAAKVAVAGSKTIEADLSARFEKQGKTKKASALSA